MKVEIRYLARYSYPARVTFSPHLFRLIPKVDRALKLRQFDFRTNTNSVIHWRRDLFDNEIASVFYPKASPHLDIKLKLKLELEPKNAFGFLLASHALHLPFAYQPQEIRVLTPYLHSAPAPKLPFWQPPFTPHTTIQTLVQLNSALHQHITYERREEGPARPSAETLELGRGACRDIAVVLVDTLRGMGLAARYASGYLCEFGTEEKRAEGALHAWVEVYLPGAGWVGLDPTNGTFCDHHHITAAVGATTMDVDPVVGSYYHEIPVTQRMTASVEILQPH